LADNARQLLSQNSVPVTMEILKIALAPEEKPSRAKVQCLLAAFERIVPALKVVEVKPNDNRKPHELSHQEIIDILRAASMDGGGDNNFHRYI
jgi:hypothetical protein